MNENNLIWIDLEMTGLNPERDFIIEIATLITDNDLNILEEGPVFAIYQPNIRLALMDKWNTHVHTSNGLIDQVKCSQYNEEIAMKKTLDFLLKWVPEKKSPICGNNVSQDRRFLLNYMPKLESYFHYRCLDVSTLKELAHRWKPDILSKIKKKNTHRALEDIKESIAELDFYKRNFICL